MNKLMTLAEDHPKVTAIITTSASTVFVTSMALIFADRHTQNKDWSINFGEFKVEAHSV